MKYNRFLAVALLLSILVMGSIAPVALAQDGTESAVAAPDATSTATAFVLQNLGSEAASTDVEFRSPDGTVTKSYLGVSIPVGAAVNMDQRYASGDPGVSPFQGSVIASSGQQLGSVVNLMRSGSVPSYESYNGLGDKTIGTSVRVLQVLKGVSSGGVIYNTSIAIQNTDTSAATSVTVTFVPDPILNPAVGGTITTPVSKTYNVAKGGMLLLDQSTQTDPNIGDKFFGSAKVESVSAPVAVVTTSSGGEQLLLAYPSYSAGSTQPIGLPSVYKNIMSSGLSYSTAFLIANMGTGDATVEITYLPTVKGTVVGKDTITIPAGTVKNVDQRYDAPSITSSDFMGAALVTPTAGSVAVMVNLRGGSQYAMTYGGLNSGVAAGGKMFLPVGYKNINSAGISWSSTIVFYTFTSDAQVKLTFNDNRSGFSPWTTSTYTVKAGDQFDLRFHGSTTGHDTFFGAVVVEVISGQVGAIMQTRGLGGAGDALMGYQGLAQ
jgi:hypothetical protein